VHVVDHGLEDFHDVTAFLFFFLIGGPLGGGRGEAAQLGAARNDCGRGEGDGGGEGERGFMLMEDCCQPSWGVRGGVAARRIVTFCTCISMRSDFRFFQGTFRRRVPARASHVTRHTSHVTRRTSHVTRHTSHVTRHTSHVARHTSHVTRHTPHVTYAAIDQSQWAALRYTS
jgi:hypothetical protein